MGSFHRSRHELVFLFRHGSASHRNNVQFGRFGRNRSNVREYHGITSSFGRATEEGNLLALHPTVKPVAMVADAILDCSARGDLVLDCFLGSGTSVIAAEPRAAVAPRSRSTPRMSTRSSVAGRPTAANAPGTPGWAGPSASSRSSGEIADIQ